MRIHLLKPNDIRPNCWNGVSRYATQMVTAITRVDPSVEWVSFYFSLRDKVPVEQRQLLERSAVRVVGARLPNLSRFELYTRMIERYFLPRLVDRAGCWISWGTNCVALPNRGRQFRTVVTIHDLVPITHPELAESRFARFVRPRLQQTAQAADLILTVSHFTASQIVERLGVSEEKIAVTYEGVDPGLADKAEHPNDMKLLADLGFAERPILSVGVAEPRKNYERGLVAYGLLRERVGTAPPWVIVGRDGWQFESFYTKRAEMGLTECVHRLSGLSDRQLGALYRTSQCLFCPSLLEGFGLPVLEAMAAGLPVVCSMGGALPEVGGDAVLTVDPYNPEAMAAALENVLIDSSLADQLAQRGRERARRFSWEQAAQMALTAFRRIV